MTTFIAVRPLENGRPVEIIEKNEQGFLVGAWFGYWNAGRGTVALYPNVTNHCVNWPGGRAPQGKIIISDRLVSVRVKKQDAKSSLSAAGGAASSVPGKEDRRAPIEGQEKIKF